MRMTIAGAWIGAVAIETAAWMQSQTHLDWLLGNASVAVVGLGAVISHATLKERTRVNAAAKDDHEQRLRAIELHTVSRETLREELDRVSERFDDAIERLEKRLAELSRNPERI